LWGTFLNLDSKSFEQKALSVQPSMSHTFSVTYVADEQFIALSCQFQFSSLCVLIMVPLKSSVLFAFCSVIIAWGPLRSEAEDVSYTRDVLPILSANCFQCHGPDEETREADLRLDTHTGSTRDLGGYTAITPGKVAKSELIARITSTEDEVMPPRDSEKTLTPKQIETLTTWIKGGAKYETHWAFSPPHRPSVPQSNNPWIRNPIDELVLAKMQSRGMVPSPEADRYTLIRRVSLDLTGLPPTIEQADAFVNDTSTDAYEKVVDRLLASPVYGERWARDWLDLARYSDTNGYEKDRPRSIWPYRDWVINALNEDIPYDQFTIEQLAGDMLPNATDQQRIATGFHRNSMLNEEGGIDPLEYRFYAMVDRVATTGTVWMGLTTGCAQCHTHKFDPITHTDYYALMGLLNNADEPDLLVSQSDIEQRQHAIDKQIAALEASFESKWPLPETSEDSDEEVSDAEDVRATAIETAFQSWLTEQQPKATAWSTITPTEMKTNLPRLEVLDDGSIFSTGDVTKRDVFDLTFNLEATADRPVTALRLEVLPDNRLPNRGPGRAFYEGRKGDFFLSDIIVTQDGKPVVLDTPSHSFGKIGIGAGTADAKNVLDGIGDTGWSTAGAEGSANHLVLNLANAITEPSQLKMTMIFERHFAASLGRFRYSVASKKEKAAATTLPVEIETILSRERVSWTPDNHKYVRDQFLNVAPELKAVHEQIAKLRQQRPAHPFTMVFQERPADNPRTIHRHHRGEYLKPQEEVTPRIPELFLDSTVKPPTNRLEFARWLVSHDNPTAGRVPVNRAWHALFGTGIVSTIDDFGTQSAFPTHPDLLDWLAMEFTDEDRLNWSMKSLHRLLVTSATYRQSSVVNDSAADDPTNEFLSRTSRVRLSAEVIRDLNLKASNLLTDKIGGPSVYPPQPESVTALAYGATKWPIANGPDRYRRSLYTFSKRTAPFAALSVFDAPSGESCVANRNRSNTPLQALTMLNDGMFVEMAFALADSTLRDVHQKANAPEDQTESTTIDEKVVAQSMFRRLCTRPLTDEELDYIVKTYHRLLARLESGELDANEMLSLVPKPLRSNAVDSSSVNLKRTISTNELAAWSSIARALMNTDEAITRQ